MSKQLHGPFERKPILDTSMPAKAALGEFLHTSSTLQPQHGDSDYWSHVIEQHSGKILSHPRLGNRSNTPSTRYENIRVVGSLSILKEVMEFPHQPHTPLAAVYLRAHLYNNCQLEGEPKAILWADYELSTASSGNGGVGMVIKLEITPHTRESYTLPPNLDAVWDELDLENITPCPEQGPLPTTFFDAQPHHLRALTRYMLTN